jgi:hypothetical protein
MSNENENEGGDESASQEQDSNQIDPVHNLKSEFNRKFQNTQAQLEAILAKNAELSAQLSQIAATRSQPEADREDELDVYDPKSIQKVINRQVTRQVEHAKSEVMEQQRGQQVLAQLAADYPELSDGTSDLSRMAVAQFQQLSPSVRASADGYRLAVREAASQLGLLPNSKRGRNDSQRRSDSEFTGLAGGGSGSARSSQEKRKSQELDPGVAEAARVFGLDLSDPKRLDSLKKRTNRKNWGKYSDE